MDENVLLIAVTLASLIGSPLIQGVKAMFELFTGSPLADKAAMITTLVVSVLLAFLAISVSGAFSAPLPANWQEWVKLIGGSIGSVFAVTTVVFKSLIKPAIEKQELEQRFGSFGGLE